MHNGKLELYPEGSMTGEGMLETRVKTTTHDFCLSLYILRYSFSVQDQSGLTSLVTYCVIHSLRCLLLCCAHNHRCRRFFPYAQSFAISLPFTATPTTR